MTLAYSAARLPHCHFADRESLRRWVRETGSCPRERRPGMGNPRPERTGPSAHATEHCGTTDWTRCASYAGMTRIRCERCVETRTRCCGRTCRPRNVYPCENFTWKLALQWTDEDKQKNGTEKPRENVIWKLAHYNATRNRGIWTNFQKNFRRVKSTDEDILCRYTTGLKTPKA